MQQPKINNRKKLNVLLKKIQQDIFYYKKINRIKRYGKFLAGAEGLEPSTNGFGDHYSTN